jgi:hypothetical protein
MNDKIRLSLIIPVVMGIVGVVWLGVYLNNRPLSERDEPNFISTIDWAGGLQAIFGPSPVPSPLQTMIPVPNPSGDDTAARVTVITPNGGEIWKAGGEYPITWNFNAGSESTVSFPVSTTIIVRTEGTPGRVGVYSRSAISNEGVNVLDYAVPSNGYGGGMFTVTVQVNSSLSDGNGGYALPKDTSDTAFVISPGVARTPLPDQDEGDL